MMNSSNKNEEMDKEALALVLESFSQEQQNSNRLIDEMMSRINNLKNRFDDFEKELEKPRPVNVNTDTRNIVMIMNVAFSEFKQLLITQRQHVVKKFQLLLFPEYKAQLFYKIVFGRWFIWLGVMLFLYYSYNWLIHYSNNQKAIKMEQLENDRIRKSWKYMYEHDGRAIRQKMDRVYEWGSEN